MEYAELVEDVNDRQSAMGDPDDQDEMVALESWYDGQLRLIAIDQGTAVPALLTALGLLRPHPEVISPLGTPQLERGIVEGQLFAQAAPTVKEQLIANEEPDDQADYAPDGSEPQRPELYRYTVCLRSEYKYVSKVICLWVHLPRRLRDLMHEHGRVYGTDGDPWGRGEPRLGHGNW